MQGRACQSKPNRARFSLTRQLISAYTSQTNPDACVLDPAIRTQYAYLEAWVSIAGNVALSAIKIALGVLLNSISLLADAAHTAADVLTSAVVLIGFRLAKAPPDEKHPFGHGRAEFLSSLAIAGLLVYAGVEFGVASYNRLVAGSAVKGNLLVAVVMVAAAACKEWMTRFAAYLGAKANAQALIGDAWHHRTDAIASALVAVAIAASSYGAYWVDAVLGIVVSVLILYTGVSLAIAAASSLIGEEAPQSLVSEIAEAVLQCDGVKGFHKVVVHDYGGRKSVSLHIQVSNDLSLLESHRIASAVEAAVKSRLPVDIVVHVEPEAEGLSG